ncbi:MarR family transcriptional regulator [Vibrio parahaemolyticus]|uniref:MarR family winged helix-turn-helix transcriptional regulator n=1 Tax=Vibrio parahaemolyticus TaxID=670 RepID=UPI0004D3438C|nr:MarR family transcriptional regulator [Vibrio parahaemolyticus]EGR1695951.1 MarR family transcriptional regulator [Vibrio parahaemolyticus]MBM5192718.1 MarR family transcriptional regulator [Vibrio parahaemolyticus]MBM5198875.1 MarR family transcriptional regulator [Vibrio parahaemolyticus]MBM5205199.1 MarR family transcriptional regulator [Vibrio parahaemolyticus]MBM5211030.1 MarR family transcriptional regulator [Vibrio parahaemolyticus]
MSQCYSPRTLNADEKLLLENQVCFPLYSAANAVIRAYRPLLDALDLTYSQYLVMMVLWEKDDTSVKQLGSQLHLDSGTLTPLLKRLEAKGFVSRGRSETDERVRVLNLTEAGRALKDQAKSVPDAIACKLTLDLEELVTLKTLCEKVLDKLS